MKRKLRAKSATTPLAEGRQPSARELTETLLTLVPELKESLTQADIELALDDRGWLGFTSNTPGELDPRTRKITIERSRLYWLRDPLAKQAVRVWTNYGFGYGVSYETEDESIQAKLDTFFKYRKNKKLLSAAGQQRLSNKLLIDGEIFFAMTATSPAPTLRTIDPLQIDKIITDPDDEETSLCYRRKRPGRDTLYYADWTLDDDNVTDVEELPDNDLDLPGTQGKPVKLERDGSGELVKVYHLPFDPLGKRGNGLLSSGLDWSREHRRFMEARVGLQQALAKFAYKLTAKGGQAALNALQTRMQSSLHVTGLQGGFEKNPPPAPGATWLQNAGADLVPMPRATGAGDARDDSYILKQMVSCSSGVLPLYFGEIGESNLASATAMELPMLKMFQGYQELWKGALRDIFSIALDEDPDKEPAQIEIEMPDILEEDLLKLGTFLTALTTMFPEAKVPEVLRPCLVSMGVENIDDVMDAIEVQREKIDAQNAANMKAAQDNAIAVASAAKPAPAAAPAVPAPSVKEVEAMDRMSKALEDSNRMPAMAPIIPEISVHPQIIIANESKPTIKTARSKREADGSMTIRIEESPNGA